MPRLYLVKLYHLPLWAWQIMPIVIALVLTTSVTYGQSLGLRSVAIANAIPGANTQYSIDFNILSNETLGSVELQFCSNSPLVEVSCVAPTGMNVSSAVLSSQTTGAGFSLSSSNDYTLVLSRPPVVFNAGTLSFNISNIINPTSVGTFYARIQTFANSTPGGTPMDQGGAAMAINNGYSISVTVPPYLLFCVGISIANYNCNQSSGDFINFGYLSPNLTSSAQSQMLIATNAKNGYTIQLSGSTMTSGNNILPPAYPYSSSVPGTSQFGLNLTANTAPSVGSNVQGPGSGDPTPYYSQSNNYRFSDGDVIASSNTVSNYRKYTVSYIINIGKYQQPGVYTTTLTYVSMANF